MEEIIVQGGNRLEGVVKVEGAKNAVLPILAAAILAETGKVNLSNVPVLSDVFTLNNLLTAINVSNEFDQENNEMTLDAGIDCCDGAALGSLWPCTSGNARWLCYRDPSYRPPSQGL